MASEDIEESISANDQVEEPLEGSDKNESQEAESNTELEGTGTEQPDEPKVKVTSETKLYDTSELAEVDETEEDEDYPNSGM